ncbi:uncharacterized protein LOC120941003 [Rana temporaria]|uniref:uncharacterized protein LOC120941003 n=1 Tax=Rana temporaria TaxID=8407 RepID=UPI001AADB3C2|nr:uncharacterized protein LOC120941003 [Rana temporaria]
MANAVSQLSLITAVQAHPELWDVAHPLHGDHVKTVSLWEDICAALCPGWEDIEDTSERKEIFKTLHRRWKSLRDRVRRDITDEDRASKSGAPAPVKKPHIYHRELMFLRENMRNSSRPTTSNIEREVAGDSLQQSNSPIGGEVNESPNLDASECPDEDSRPMDVVTTGSREAAEPRGRGGVRGRGRGRGRGRQPRGASNTEGDEDLVTLLKEVRQERRNVDTFLDPNNPRTTFCRSLYPILEDIGGEEEKLCMDRIYAVTREFRFCKLTGRPPPIGDLCNASFPPPMASGTSAVLPSPSLYHPTHQRQQQPTPSQSQSGDFTPATSSHFPSPYPAPRHQQDYWNERQTQFLPRPESTHPHGDQVSTATYHHL